MKLCFEEISRIWTYDINEIIIYKTKDFRRLLKSNSICCSRSTFSKPPLDKLDSLLLDKLANRISHLFLIRAKDTRDLYRRMSIQEQLCRNTASNADGERHSRVAIRIPKELQGGSVGFLLGALVWGSNKVGQLNLFSASPFDQELVL